MKPRCKLIKLCLLEFAGQWKMLLIFFLISILILSPLISIVQMAVEIPKKIDSYTYDYSYTWIKIDDMKEGYLETIESRYKDVMDVYVYDALYLCGSIDDWYMTDSFLDAYGNFCYGGIYISQREKTEHNYIDILNQQMIQGDAVTEENYDQNYIWLEDFLAEEKSLALGDVIEIRSNTNPEKTESYTVKGIYQDGEDENGFILLNSAFYVDGYAAGDEHLLSQVNLYPHTLQCYAEIMKKLQQTGYKDDLDTNSMTVSFIYVKYLIYGTEIFMIFLMVTLFLTLLNMYYQRRRQNYALYRMLGMRTGHIWGILAVVMSALLLGTFGGSLILSPYINRYIVDFMEDILPQIELEISIRNMRTIWVLVGAEALLLAACGLSVCSVNRDSISEYMHKLNE